MYFLDNSFKNVLKSSSFHYSLLTSNVSFIFKLVYFTRGFVKVRVLEIRKRGNLSTYEKILNTFF